VARKKPAARAKSAKSAKARPAKKTAGKPAAGKKKATGKAAKKMAKRGAAARVRPKRARNIKRPPRAKVLPVLSLGPADQKPARRAGGRKLAPEVLEEFRVMLRERRRDLLSGIRNELGESQRSRGSHLSDAADIAADSADGDLAFALVESESSELARIDKALVRIAEGTYGFCESCGCRVPTGRLRAVPFATSCVQCQETLERTGGGLQGDEVGWEKVGDEVTPDDD